MSNDKKKNDLFNYAFKTPEEIKNLLKIQDFGLNFEEVKKMKEQFGVNLSLDDKKHQFWLRIKHAFFNSFNLILVTLGIISIVTDIILASNFTRNFITPILIFSMVLISGIIRLIVESKALSAKNNLKKLIDEEVFVLRNGKKEKILASKLVVGDYLFLEAGSKIPADIRILKAQSLYISEASLTGESKIYHKSSKTLENNHKYKLKDYENLAFMTTTIIGGKLEGVVLKVGKETLYGKSLVLKTSDKNFFLKGANEISLVMLKFMAILIPIVFIFLSLSGGKVLDSFVFALSIALGLVPELLPMVVTATLAKGSNEMKKSEVLVKDINAIEAFGSMDILCLDKTGTLTNENLILEYYMDLLGNESSEVLKLAYLNSFYHTGVKNPLDKAILEAESLKALKLEEYKENHSYIFDIPFDYERKSASVLVSNKDNYLLILKGNVSEVLKRCKKIYYKKKTYDILDDAINNVNLVINDLLQSGMKVIAVAVKEIKDKNTYQKESENDLTLVGYLAFFDAPKASAKSSILGLKDLNVTSKILSGDQELICTSIAKRVGIKGDKVLTGSDIDNLSDNDLALKIEEVDVFAELSPNNKSRIIEALKENGHVVGYLGDGINDLSALKTAHVGISVDSALDACKEEADILLLKKDLNVLQKGVVTGRKTFNNINKYIKITASSNLGNILAIVIASIFLPFLPMTAIQILLLNILYDLLCMVLPWDNVDKEEIKKRKDWNGKSLGRFMLTFGPLSTFFDILTFILLYFVICPMFTGGLTYKAISDPELLKTYVLVFQTGWFLESMWSQIIILYFLRTKKLPFINSKPSKPVLIITVLGIIGFTLLTFSKVAKFLGFVKMPGLYFIFLFLIILGYMLFTSILKKYYLKKYQELL